MELLDFAVTVILVTASGALAPGPLFFANLSKGAKSGARSGFVFSVAHTVVEFTLVMLLAFGLLAIVNEIAVRMVIGFTGGVVLVAFGVFQVYGSLKSEPKSVDRPREITSKKLVIMGLTLTGLNPFFIFWWLTAGAQLIIVSLEFASLAGVVLMYVCHVWMDYVWLTLTAHFAKTGLNIVGFKWYRLLLALFGVCLVYYGLNFFFSSIWL